LRRSAKERRPRRRSLPSLRELCSGGPQRPILEAAEARVQAGREDRSGQLRSRGFREREAARKRREGRRMMAESRTAGRGAEGKERAYCMSTTGPRQARRRGP
jgi:hypothetical protein